MPLGDKVKAALPLRATTLKQQAMITGQSLKPALEIKEDSVITFKVKYDKRIRAADVVALLRQNAGLKRVSLLTVCRLATLHSAIVIKKISEVFTKNVYSVLVQR